jgi:hypothetical protein
MALVFLIASLGLTDFLTLNVLEPVLLLGCMAVASAVAVLAFRSLARRANGLTTSCARASE